jgi:hypothetical protein
MELVATELVQQHGCEIEELPWRDTEGGDHRWIVARWKTDGNSIAGLQWIEDFVGRDGFVVEAGFSGTVGWERRGRLRYTRRKWFGE